MRLTIVLVAAWSLLVVAGVALAAAFGIPSFVLLADPVYVADRPAYTGAVSQAGVLAWTVGASVALFAGVLVGSRVLRDLGLLTAFLALDDLFLLHDGVLPFPEVLFFAALGAAVLLVLCRHGAELRADRARPALATAVLLLSLPVVNDVSMLDKVTEIAAVVEETFKVAGITVWAGAMVLLSAERVRAAAARPAEGAGVSTLRPDLGRRRAPLAAWPGASGAQRPALDLDAFYAAAEQRDKPSLRARSASPAAAA